MLTNADPFDFSLRRGGRVAADEVGATPFGRPGSDNDALWSITQAATVPVPADVWLFGSGLLMLPGISGRKKAM